MPEQLRLDVSQWELPKYAIRELSPKKNAYCVCIPVINEGDRIQKQLKEMHAQGIHEYADIIILDGGSTDDSLNESFLRSVGVHVLLTKQDTGKLSTQLRMGYAYALQQDYEGIVTVDGNGKDGIDAIPHFIQELKSGLDFVQGSRFVPGGKGLRTPLKRLLAIRFIHAPLISLAARFWYTDTTNGFRGYSRRYLLDPRVQPFRALFAEYELLAYLSVRAPQLGFRTKEIPVTRAYPIDGTIPTKIHGNVHTTLLRVLWRTLIGHYNPTQR